MLTGLLTVLIVGTLANSVDAGPGGCHRTSCYPRYDGGYAYRGECGGYRSCDGYSRYDGYSGYDSYSGYGRYDGYGGYGRYGEYNGSGEYGW